jgi:hypothetical protein
LTAVTNLIEPKSRVVSDVIKIQEHKLFAITSLHRVGDNLIDFISVKYLSPNKAHKSAVSSINRLSLFISTTAPNNLVSFPLTPSQQ